MPAEYHPIIEAYAKYKGAEYANDGPSQNGQAWKRNSSGLLVRRGFYETRKAGVNVRRIRPGWKSKLGRRRLAGDRPGLLMAQPAPVQTTYKGGMKRDGAREAMPQGACWNLVDFLPEVLGAVLRKRGGYEYASIAMPSGAGIISGIMAEYIDGQSVLVSDGYSNWYDDQVPDRERGHRHGGVMNPAASSSTTTWSSSSTPTGRSRRRRSRARRGYTRWPTLAVVLRQAATPRLQGRRLDRRLCGGAQAHLLLHRRSARELGPDVNKWVDMSYPITGFAGLSNAVLVF